MVLQPENGRASSRSSMAPKSTPAKTAATKDSKGMKQQTLHGFFITPRSNASSTRSPAPTPTSATPAANKNSQLQTPSTTGRSTGLNTGATLSRKGDLDSSPTAPRGRGGRHGGASELPAEPSEEDDDEDSAPVKERSSSRKSSNTSSAIIRHGQPTPPRSDGLDSMMDVDDDDDDDEEPLLSAPRRRSCTKRRILNAESDDDEDVGEGRDVFTSSSPIRKPAKSSAKGLRPKKRRVDDEDDFIVDDDEPLSQADDEGSVFEMDKDEDDAESNTKKSSSKRSSSLNACKMNASTPRGTSSSSASPAPTLKRADKSDLTKAERRREAEKAFKKANEQRYGFLLDLRDKDRNPVGSPDYDPRTLYIPPSAWKEFSPFEKQYWTIKQNHMDTVLFCQKGKFYELFEMDAEIGHREFDLKLTDRVKMKMVGIPEASFDMFAAKFLALGYKVGRVDQCETSVAMEMRTGAKRGGGGDIVRRELRNVLTTGTIVDGHLLADDLGSHCVAIKESISTSGDPPSFGVCIVDASTAEFKLSAFDDDFSRTRLDTLIRSLRVKEILYEKGNLSTQTQRLLRNSVAHSCLWTALRSGSEFLDEESTLDELKAVFPPSALDDDEASGGDRSNAVPKEITSMLDNRLAVSALGATLWYLRQLNLDKELFACKNFNIFDPIRQGQSLILDAQSLGHMQVLVNDQGGDAGTLHKLLNRCMTPFGKRLFRYWLTAPLRRIDQIKARQDAVEDFMNHPRFEDEFDSFARGLPDLERLISRIQGKKCRPKDFVNVLKNFDRIQRGVELLLDCTSEFEHSGVENILRGIPDVGEIVKRLRGMYTVGADDSFVPAPGVHDDFDQADKEIADVEGELEALIPKYRQELGLRSKEIQFKHIGTKEIYQVEVPNGTKVPREWKNMSSTKSVKRYYSPAVERLVQKLKEGREVRVAVVKDFALQVYEEFSRDAALFLGVVKVLAEVDCVLSLAKASAAMGEPCCRPELVESDRALIEFETLRHPCMIGTAVDFIPNDVKLGGESCDMMLLTGGNMAGKSTLSRTVAAGVIIAQMGCWVPAERARISPVDRIASRMGANDRIFAASSTFMVEMQEAARIINESTPKSLVLMDELGRGTSTFDGVAIATAVAHHLASRTGCLSLFATHYHSLAETFTHHPRVKLKHMGVLVDDERREVVFTYKLADGLSPSSYGINVAGLAGVPAEVCARAEAVAGQFMEARVERQGERRAERGGRMGATALSDFAWLFKRDRLDKEDLRVVETIRRGLGNMAVGEGDM